MLDPRSPLSQFLQDCVQRPRPPVMMILLAVLCLHARSRMDVYTRLFDFLASDLLLPVIADARALNLCNTSNNRFLLPTIHVQLSPRSNDIDGYS